MAVIAFIPIRGGSKGIPKKNIKIMLGRPLVYWVLDAAIECDIIQKIYVSTDSDEIKKCINNYDKCSDKIVTISRSPESATDEAPSELVLTNFCDDYNFEEVFFIQATSPLLSSRDLYKAYNKYVNNKYDSMLSVVNQKRFIWDINGKPINYNPNDRPRRQDWNGYFVENGSFYLSKREYILRSNCRISGNIGLFEMSEESFFEIDSVVDWKIVEELLKIKKMNIKLFLTDVDGCLTDAGMIYSENGDELKKFNTHDGMGFELLRKNGIKTGIVTSEKTGIVQRRADKLKVDYLFQGVKNKLEIVMDLCKKMDISISNIAYIGDDINDYELLTKVGHAACPKNAVKAIKDIPGIIQLSKNGGDGAIREFVEKLFN